MTLTIYIQAYKLIPWPVRTTSPNPRSCAFGAALLLPIWSALSDPHVPSSRARSWLLGLDSRPGSSARLDYTPLGVRSVRLLGSSEGPGLLSEPASYRLVLEIFRVY